MGLNVDIQKIGNVHIVNCDGLIETNTSQKLKDAIGGLLKVKQYKIVVNLSKTTFMCSSAWGAVIGSLKEARQGGGDILLAEMSDEAESGYYMANFNEIIESRCSVKEAVESFS